MTFCVCMRRAAHTDPHTDTHTNTHRIMKSVFAWLGYIFCPTIPTIPAIDRNTLVILHWVKDSRCSSHFTTCKCVAWKMFRMVYVTFFFSPGEPDYKSLTILCKIVSTQHKDLVVFCLLLYSSPIKETRAPWRNI